MRSYFFIPANKLNKLSSIKDLGVSEIVIDLEDAVKHSELNTLTKQLIENAELSRYYIRVPIFDPITESTDFSVIRSLHSSGFYKFVLPKISALEEFKALNEQISFEKNSLIILIETPRLLLDIENLLRNHHQVIFGLAMGSHDFMQAIGGDHSLENLEIVRQKVLYLARAYNKTAIDIASMDLSDLEKIEHEIIDGFKKGYDAKFIIHPKQLKVFNQVDFYNENDYKWAVKVNEAQTNQGNVEEFGPVIIDDLIIERPHLMRAQKILDYFAQRNIQ